MSVVEELEPMDTDSPDRDPITEMKEKVKETPREDDPKEEQENGDQQVKQIKMHTAVDPSVIFRCKNNIFDCPYKATYLKMLEHEKECVYDVDECPLDIISKCGWRGHEADFLDHRDSFHPGVKFAPNGRNSLWSNFVNITNENRKIILVVLAYQELFYSVAEVRSGDGLVTWAVYFLGNPAEASEYSYKISFEGEKVARNKQCYSIRRMVEGVKNGDVSFREDACGIIFYKMLKGLCARNDLVYTVRIRKTASDEGVEDDAE